MDGANAAPNTTGAVSVPKTSPASSWTFTPSTATPIKHLVVIFQENVSFDHYFATYPHAENRPGEIPFTAYANTPAVAVTRASATRALARGKARILVLLGIA